jgi:dTDP-4-dehydrorhamnose 3,5-epimerase-like enzyme
METVTMFGMRLRHQEYDRIPIPENVPALGVEKGDEGVIRGLHFDNETVLAFVMVSYSTGQTRGWVILEIKPENKVRSYTVD